MCIRDRASGAAYKYFNKSNHAQDLFRGNVKQKALGAGLLALTLGSPVRSYLYSKQLKGEGMMSDMDPDEIALMTGGENPDTEYL